MMIAYVVVKVTMPDDAEPLTVIENCEYSFTHPQILDTEIEHVTEEYHG